MAPDPLDSYRYKRDFSRTSEPQGGPSTGDKPTYVVQKHAARRLHYDVRFEVDGVMASWAVPKGPSYDPKVKRLAVHVEDHPLDYQSFEGTIPAGEYGGGAVIVWDRGTYRNITERHGRPMAMRAAIEAGHVSVLLEGDKLKGGWSFTRTSTGDGGKESWIMVKRRDETADARIDITASAPDSVRSGRSVDEVGAPPAPTAPKQHARACPPDKSPAAWKAPMLAELVKHAPAGSGWVYERKLDGLRCIIVRNGQEVELWSRNHLSFARRFPQLVAAARELAVDNFVLDGEIVAMDGDRTSFALLQQSGSPAIAQLHVFDVLHLLGSDTTQLGLDQRKALLTQAVADGPFPVVAHVAGDPDALLAQACRDGWEGLIAKRLDSPYRTGRSSDWRKLKCQASQELVIGGWTEPRGARAGFGALLVGFYDDDGLHYAGKVGTGFTVATLESLHRQLEHLETDETPFVERVRERSTHWARPVLVANIGFSEWTADAKLRHPRFDGLRPDKDARSVRREASP